MYKVTVLVVLIICVYSVHTATGMAPWPRPRRSFQSIQFPAPGRAGRSCHDFCAIAPNMCKNGGHCVTDELTCLGSCECLAGWTGKWCQVPKEPLDLDAPGETAIADAPIPASGFMSDLESMASNPSRERVGTTFHNANMPSGISRHFDSMMQTTWPQVTKSEPRMPVFPKQDRGSVGTISRNESLSDRENDKILSEACTMDCTNGNCINMNGDYKCKPRIDASSRDAPKVCGPGFECDHGVCDMKALENNFYSCICEDSYVGQFCSTKCPLECGENGNCDIHVADNSYKCYCLWNYTGVNCSELVPDDPVALPPDEVFFHWYVVGVSVAVVIVVLSALVMSGYIMWRQRLVFVLKIVHYFQQYEDDDGKEYDAFISYKACPRDEHFVLHELYPKLERDFQYKLCVHFRDFLPGETIANNIVKAIESSRRTIIVLSPEYVNSEWCRMEYQKAQHEMLKLKHKIIPIVLEDISGEKNVDKNLKSILNSVTYLEWPGQESNISNSGNSSNSSSVNSKRLEKFWKKLELSLPKKSVQKSPSLSSASETSSSSSGSSESGLSESALSSSLKSVSATLAKSQSHTQSPKRYIKSDDRSLTDSPTPSNETSTTSSSSSPKIRRKRKDFKHFMDKLVRGKFFNRQDSTSSQSALVDAETLASRSSCGSVTESMLTESSEPTSTCSSPSTPRKLKDGASDVESNSFFPMCSSSLTKEHFQQSLRKCKELADVREKDHCDDSDSEGCRVGYGIHRQDTEHNTQGVLNEGFVIDECHETSEKNARIEYECECCTYVNVRGADNNCVRISAIEGTDQLKLQKLPRDDCRKCGYVRDHHHVMSRNPYRGSMKHHKDAANEMMRQNRVGSLPRNYKNSQILRTTSLECEYATRPLPHSRPETISNGASGVLNCYMDLCESV